MDADKDTKDSDQATAEDTELLQFRKNLEEWKEILLQLDDVLLWRRLPTFNAALVVITVVFFLIWYVEPPVLTLVALLGFAASVLDFAVPAIASKLLTSGEWSGEQERHFEEVTARLLHSKRCMSDAYATLISWKLHKPALYVAVTTSNLLALAWVGSWANNLWLVYIAVVVAACLPGLLHHNIIQRNTQLLRSRLKSLLLQAKKKVKKQ